MTVQEERLGRFHGLNTEKSFSFESVSSSEGLVAGRIGQRTFSISAGIRKGLQSFSSGIKKIRKTFTSNDLDKPKEESGSSKKILDPQQKFLQRWNKIFLSICVLSISIDPLFFYIPVLSSTSNCLSLDHNLEVITPILRSFTDVLYVLHIFFQFRTGFIAPISRVFGRGVLVEDSKAIANRYLSSYFWVDVLSVLPLPQVIVLVVKYTLRALTPLYIKNLLRYTILIQMVPRIVRIIPLYSSVVRTSGLITETAWAGAALNLFIYMLASHVMGALYYLFAVERVDSCWRKAACDSRGCDFTSLYCGSGLSQSDSSFLVVCDPKDPPDPSGFNFGIYLSALQSNIVRSEDFLSKLLYCFWWGLQNLSSLGQNLKTSTYIGEICFAVLISICGLVLFALLIGNMQTYLQSSTMRLEEMRVQRRDAEQWMSHRLLPESLKEKIRRYEQFKWLEFKGVNEEELVQNLPKDLRRDIKRHLCLALLMRVPMFNIMDDQLLNAMCERLKPKLYTEHTYVIREGDPVEEMIFIMRGRLESVTTNGGRTGFFNAEFLKEGGFCGEELLTWALDPRPIMNLPYSTRTVRSLSDVEAFALTSDDLRFVAKQFRRLHSKQLRHTFRFYSQQWRTWAACFIQAAWRRHSKKKVEELLSQEEEKLQAALAENRGSGSSPSLGATIYASRFAANALRGVRAARRTKLLARSPLINLPKPAEPNFAEEDD